MNQALKIIIPAAAVFFFSVAAAAQDLQNLTLDAAIALARENKPVLRTYTFEEQINAARLAEPRLLRSLRLSVTADAQVNPFLPASVIPVGQFNLQNPTDDTRAVRFGTWWQAGVGLTGSISLVDASIDAQIREQAFQSQLTANNRRGAEAGVVAAVTQAYYALLLAEAEVRFLEADLKRVMTLLSEVEQRQSDGAALPADINTARMQANDAHLQLERAAENRLLARKNLAFRLGLPVERATELAPGESLTDLVNRIQATANSQFDPAAVEQNHPDLHRLVLDIHLQNLKIDTEKARLKPTLKASAFVGLNNLSDAVPLFAENSWFSNGNAALQLNIPISERWELKKRTLPLTLKQQQNAEQIDELQQQLRFEFESAYSAYTLAGRQLNIRKTDINLAESNLEIARAKYAGGGGLASGITDGEAILRQKQFAWLQTAYDLLLAELNMRLARGEVK